MDELDPRWEWSETRRLCDPQPHYVRGPCRHLETVPVESVSGERVATLCLTCDAQLPAEWSSSGANFPPVVLDHMERRTTDPAALMEIGRLRADRPRSPSLQRRPSP